MPNVADMTGSPISVGDLLVDDRGLVFVALETDATIAAEGLVRGRGKSGERLLRQRFVLRVPGAGALLKEELRDMWRFAYEQHRRPMVRRELAERRRGISKSEELDRADEPQCPGCDRTHEAGYCGPRDRNVSDARLLRGDVEVF